LDKTSPFGSWHPAITNKLKESKTKINIFLSNHYTSFFAKLNDYINVS